LEAGAAGLPVISTRHAGISDVVLHGKTGFLVDEGDINGMSEYLQRILRDPQLAMEMGQNAREYIIETFNMERSIGELRKVFEICLNQQRGNRKQSLDQTATLTTPDYHTSN
jgi:colanic acid/amylovoran biosynthesis glycosyltransferase